jgi:hypothetical protein
MQSDRIAIQYVRVIGGKMLAVVNSHSISIGGLSLNLSFYRTLEE